MSIISYTPPWSLFRPHSKGYENTLGNFRNKLYLKVDCVNWNYFSINADQSGATIRVPKVPESVITVVIFHNHHYFLASLSNPKEPLLTPSIGTQHL